MRRKQIEAQLAELRESVAGHAKQDAVDAALAAAKSAETKANALKADLADVKAEFAGLRESVRNAAALAVGPASAPEPQPEAVTPITRAPRSRKTS